MLSPKRDRTAPKPSRVDAADGAGVAEASFGDNEVENRIQ
jgi:hypothetical protein